MTYLENLSTTCDSEMSIIFTEIYYLLYCAQYTILRDFNHIMFILAD